MRLNRTGIRAPQVHAKNLVTDAGGVKRAETSLSKVNQAISDNFLKHQRNAARSPQTHRDRASSLINKVQMIGKTPMDRIAARVASTRARSKFSGLQPFDFCIADNDYDWKN